MRIVLGSKCELGLEYDVPGLCWGPGGWVGSNIDLRCSSAANRALLDHFEGVSDDLPTILPTISTFPQEQEQGGKRVHTVLLSR